MSKATHTSAPTTAPESIVPRTTTVDVLAQARRPACFGESASKKAKTHSDHDEIEYEVDITSLGLSFIDSTIVKQDNVVIFKANAKHSNSVVLVCVRLVADRPVVSTHTLPADSVDRPLVNTRGGLLFYDKKDGFLGASVAEGHVVMRPDPLFDLKLVFSDEDAKNHPICLFSHHSFPPLSVAQTEPLGFAGTQCMPALEKWLRK